MRSYALYLHGMITLNYIIIGLSFSLLTPSNIDLQPETTLFLLVIKLVDRVMAHWEYIIPWCSQGTQMFLSRSNEINSRGRKTKGLSES